VVFSNSNAVVVVAVVAVAKQLLPRQSFSYRCPNARLAIPYDKRLLTVKHEQLFKLSHTKFLNSHSLSLSPVLCLKICFSIARFFSSLRKCLNFILAIHNEMLSLKLKTIAMSNNSNSYDINNNNHIIALFVGCNSSVSALFYLCRKVSGMGKGKSNRHQRHILHPHDNNNHNNSNNSRHGNSQRP